MNEEALLQQYISKVEYYANHFAHNDLDREDLFQEGLIGLLSAIRNYDSSRNASFSTYASHCIKNRILDSLKTFDEVQMDEDFDAPDNSLGPEELLLIKDYLISFKQQLSDLEYKVLIYMLDGYTNAKVADLLSTSVSCIYNANQRIRQKIAHEFNLASSVQADRK